VIKAGDRAVESLGAAEEWTMMSKMTEQMKEVVSVRPVFSAALKAWQDGKFGEALAEDGAGRLGRALKSVAGMGSPEIGSAMSKAVEAGDGMPYAQGVTWAMTARIQSYQTLFRITQATGLGTDAVDKADSLGHPLPGWEDLKSFLPHGSDG
jgi:hypothetical protein